MKKFFLSLIFISSAIAAFAQSDRYTDAMQKNVALLDSAKSVQDFQTMANTFERIANAEQTQWLPYYYAGYCEAITSFIMSQQDVSKIDEWADKAESNIKKADSLNPKNSEINCVKSMIATARIMVDPQSRGQEYGMESAQDLETAEQLNPENPRVYLLQGQNAFYTPAQYGGGKDIAKPLLEKAVEKFAAFKPQSSIDPHWGEAQAKSLLAQCK